MTAAQRLFTDIKRLCKTNLRRLILSLCPLRVTQIVVDRAQLRMTGIKRLLPVLKHRFER